MYVRYKIGKLFEKLYKYKTISIKIMFQSKVKWNY